MVIPMQVSCRPGKVNRRSDQTNVLPLTYTNNTNIRSKVTGLKSAKVEGDEVREFTLYRVSSVFSCPVHGQQCDKPVTFTNLYTLVLSHEPMSTTSITLWHWTNLWNLKRQCHVLHGIIFRDKIHKLSDCHFSHLNHSAFQHVSVGVCWSLFDALQSYVILMVTGQ